MATREEIDRLLHYMPLVVRSRVNDASRKFCASIIARSKRGPINPTPKQVEWMRSLVDRFQADKLRDSSELIDRNDPIE